MSEAPELISLADALRGLVPNALGLDRDAVLFRAGQASALPSWQRRWAWPATTILSLAAALGLGLVLVLRPPTTHTVERVVYVTVERQAPPPTPSAVHPPEPEVAPPAEPYEPMPTPPGRYAQVREHLLRWGLDGLGTPPPLAPVRPVTAESLAQPF